jgi:hypothetical protein
MRMPRMAVISDRKLDTANTVACGLEGPRVFEAAKVARYCAKERPSVFCSDIVRNMIKR